MYAYLHCAQHGKLPKLTEVLRYSEKDALHEFKVIQGHQI